MDGEYYTARKPELLRAFEREAQDWKPVLALQHREQQADTLLRQAHEEFEALLPHIPYIGGDENHLTASLLESAWALALYKAMQKHGATAQETGKILYDVAVARRGEPPAAIPPAERLSPEQLMDRRKQRAARSQERRHAEDYVYEFVAGDGQEFDYGYDFLECATQKFYHAQGADEFTPFFCFLDFPKSGTGLTRTMTLAEGHPRCNHRFKEGGKTEFGWPPPFLKRE
jgi:hypothetical protein